jgi:hypothetical protein
MSMDAAPTQNKITLAGIGPLVAKSPRPGYWEFSTVTEAQPRPRLLVVLSPFIWTVLLAYPIYALANYAFTSGGTPLDALVLGVLTFFAVGKPIQAFVERWRKGRSRTLVRIRISEPAKRVYVDGSKYVFPFDGIKKMVIRKKAEGWLQLLLATSDSVLVVEESSTPAEATALREHASSIAGIVDTVVEEQD